MRVCMLRHSEEMWSVVRVLYVYFVAGITAAQLLSLRDAFVQNCHQNRFLPNSEVVQQLPDLPYTHVVAVGLEGSQLFTTARLKHLRSLARTFSGCVSLTVVQLNDCGPLTTRILLYS